MRTPVREAFSYGIRHIHCDSMKLCFIESQWICRAVSSMKMPPVREYASSLMAPICGYACDAKLELKHGQSLKVRGVARGGRAGDWAPPPQSDAHSPPPTCTGVYEEPSFWVLVSPLPPCSPLILKSVATPLLKGIDLFVGGWFKEFWAHWDHLFKWIDLT